MSEIPSVSSIKAMDERHRKKRRADELLTVILASAEEKNDMLNNLNTSIVVNDTINSCREEVIDNSTQLVTLNSKIILLEEENKKFKMDIEDSQRRLRLNSGSNRSSES